MDNVMFLLLGVRPAYYHECLLLTNECIPACACTSGALFWDENGLSKYLLFDVGYGVCESLARHFVSEKKVFPQPCLDGILITHAHLDHIAEIPIFIESYRRLQKCLRPVSIFCTQATFDILKKIFGWLFQSSKNTQPAAEWKNIEAGNSFNVGHIEIASIDASSHFPGAVNYLISFQKTKIFIGWDIRNPPAENILNILVNDSHLAFLEANTMEDHPTGHCSARAILCWAFKARLRNIVLVHYSGFEDGQILTWRECQNMIPSLAPQMKKEDGYKITFGKQGDVFRFENGFWTF